LLLPSGFGPMTRFKAKLRASSASSIDHLGLVLRHVCKAKFDVGI
jgi:hypothetical protein